MKAIEIFNQKISTLSNSEIINECIRNWMCVFDGTDINNVEQSDIEKFKEKYDLTNMMTDVTNMMTDVCVDFTRKLLTATEAKK
jgi:hypothetical protein